MYYTYAEWANNMFYYLKLKLLIRSHRLETGYSCCISCSGCSSGGRAALATNGKDGGSVPGGSSLDAPSCSPVCSQEAEC